ncbi:MAG: hypothetical protein AB4041_15075 [Microcystaceae cyanobacterium]
MNKQAVIFTLLASISLPTLLQAQTSNNSILTETIEAHIKEEEGGFFDNTKYKIAEIDLNDDQKKDALVFLIGSYWCGTGGCTLLVFEQTDNNYRLVSQVPLVREPVIVSDNKTKGWYDIIIHNSGGGLPAKNVALKFDGTTYPENPSALPPIRKIEGTTVFPKP